MAGPTTALASAIERWLTLPTQPRLNCSETHLFRYISESSNGSILPISRERVASFLSQMPDACFINADLCRLIFESCRKHMIYAVDKNNGMLSVCPSGYEDNTFETALISGNEVLVAQELQNNSHLKYSKWVSNDSKKNAYPLLSIACRQGSLQMVQAFIGVPDSDDQFERCWNNPEGFKRGSQTVNRFVSFVDFPLIAAVQSGNADLVEYMLRSGFTLSPTTKCPNKALDAVRIAASEGQASVLKVLFDHLGQQTWLEGGTPQEKLRKLLQTQFPEPQDNLQLRPEFLLTTIMLIENGLDRQSDLKQGFLDAVKAKKLLMMQLMLDKGLQLDNETVIAALFVIIKERGWASDQWFRKETRANRIGNFLKDRMNDLTLDQKLRLFHTALSISGDQKRSYYIRLVGRGNLAVNFATMQKFFILIETFHPIEGSPQSTIRLKGDYAAPLKLIYEQLDMSVGDLPLFYPVITQMGDTIQSDEWEALKVFIRNDLQVNVNATQDPIQKLCVNLEILALLHELQHPNHHVTDLKADVMTKLNEGVAIRNAATLTFNALSDHIKQRLISVAQRLKDCNTDEAWQNFLRTVSNN